MLALDTRVDARPLAFARIGIGLAGLLNVAESWVVLHRLVTEEGLPMPGVSFAPGVTSGLAGVTAAVGAFAAVFVVVGLATRPAALFLAASLGAMMLLDQQVYSNHVALSLWCALWLALGRSDARWSLRARLHGPSDVPLGDQVLLMTQLTVVYLFTGLLKINPEFLSGSVIQLNSHLDIPAGLAQLMAVGAVAAELSLAVGLWVKGVRWVAALGGLALHAAIPLVMYQPLPLVSFSLTVMCLYPLFFARPTGSTPAAAPAAAPSAVVSA